MANNIEDRVEEYVYLGYDEPFRSKCIEKQSQYLSQYIGRSRFWHCNQRIPEMGLDLRFKNLEDGSYHKIMIHSEDAETFIRRVNSYIAGNDPDTIKEYVSQGYIFE